MMTMLQETREIEMPFLVVAESNLGRHELEKFQTKHEAEYMREWYEERLNEHFEIKVEERTV